MSNFKYIVFVLGLLLCKHSVRAADVKEDLKKMKSVYEKAASFSMALELQMFTHAHDTKPLVVEKGAVKKQNNFYYSSIENTINVQNNTDLIHINGKNNTILIAKAAKLGKPDGLMPYDSVLTWESSKMRYIENTPGTIRIEYNDPDAAMYKKIELCLNAKTHCLTEIVYYLSKEEDTSEMDDEDYSYEKIVIKYSDIKLNTAIPENTFASASYISKEKGKTLGVGRFSKYKIIDQRETKFDIK